MGVILLVCALWELFVVSWPLIPVLLIGFGVGVLFGAFRGQRTRRADGGLEAQRTRECERVLSAGRDAKWPENERGGIGVMQSLPIIWQRLVDSDGRTCERCDATYRQMQQAIETLTEALRSSWVRPRSKSFLRSSS